MTIILGHPIVLPGWRIDHSDETAGGTFDSAYVAMEATDWARRPLLHDDATHLPIAGSPGQISLQTQLGLGEPYYGMVKIASTGDYSRQGNPHTAPPRAVIITRLGGAVDGTPGITEQALIDRLKDRLNAQDVWCASLYALTSTPGSDFLPAHAQTLYPEDGANRTMVYTDDGQTLSVGVAGIPNDIVPTIDPERWTGREVLWIVVDLANPASFMRGWGTAVYHYNPITHLLEAKVGFNHQEESNDAAAAAAAVTAARLVGGGIFDRVQLRVLHVPWNFDPATNADSDAPGFYTAMQTWVDLGKAKLVDALGAAATGGVHSLIVPINAASGTTGATPDATLVEAADVIAAWITAFYPEV